MPLQFYRTFICNLEPKEIYKAPEECVIIDYFLYLKSHLCQQLFLFYAITLK